MKLARAFVFAAVLVIAQMAMAQAPAKPPAPGPEVKKLSYFVGKWTSEGESKESPFGPAGKFKGTETDEWFTGGFFVVAHAAVTGTMGNEKEMSVLGYNSEEKVYTYHSVSSMGEAEEAKGTVEGDTWTWTNESKVNGQSYKGRYTMKVLSPTSYTFKFESSTDGTQWTTVVEGKATKVAAGAATAKKPAAK